MSKIEDFIKQLASAEKVLIGPLKKDGLCVFCNRPIAKGEHCFCKEAEQKQIKVQKINRIYSEFNWEFDDIQFDKHFNWKVDIANFPKQFAGKDFDDYIVETDEHKRNLEIAKEYAENGLEHYLNADNLIFVGNFGNAKTMLFSIIGEHIIRKFAIQVMYSNFYDFSEKIKNSFNKNKNRDEKGVSTEEILKKHKEAPILMLDDIDKVTPTSFMVEMMYGIANYRADNHLPTCITSNHSLEDLAKNFYGEAIISRFFDNSIKAKFTGENWRLR